MCWMVYIGSDRALPLVGENDAAYPKFGVTPVEGETADAVRAVLELPFIYYAASWQGCGCGFTYVPEAEYQADIQQNEPWPEFQDILREYQEEGRASVGSLMRYLTCVSQEQTVKLYVVWAGEEGAVPELRERVSPDYFGGDGFGFGFAVFYTVVSDHEGQSSRTTPSAS